MLLDYSYSKKQSLLSASYITDAGTKKILKFNCNRFKTYYYNPEGRFMSWNGKKCDEKWTNNPSWFDIKTFFMEMDNEYRELITKKTFPKVYTWDIEVSANENGEFCSAEDASAPITTISIVNPELDAIVLAVRPLTEQEQQWCSSQFDNYLENTTYYHEIKLQHKPSFRYIYFNNEEDMILFFLKNIVAKAPIMAGWNCIFFDWQYIVNRINKYFPNISITSASCTNMIRNKRYVDLKGDAVVLPMPEHTLIIDMMEVIKSEDHKVLPIKESMSLNYIADASMGIKKIEYEGTLDDLYHKDYPRYVYYNAIDSILVQLINYRFKTMDHIYLYSLYCTEKIDKCFSKIATTESLVFQEFYNRGLKIVYEENTTESRSGLVGAYVKVPVTGIHEFVCCNDFASLYPSTIRTCNLSFENYVGAFWNQEELNKYRSNSKYYVVGGTVYLNDGSGGKEKAGRWIKDCFNEEELNKYRKDKNYFVTVNGTVYKNDKDYTFRRILETLKANRDESKYLGKRIDAEVCLDIEHIIEGINIDNHTYDDKIINALKKIGLNIVNSNDLLKLSKEALSYYYRELKNEITYYSCHEHAMKLLMNSMYGGCSHVKFYWYNMNLANDVTGESRNLIRKMEQHIPEFIYENWLTMHDIHNMLGIEIDMLKAKKWIDNYQVISEIQDPDAFHGTSYVSIVYGDTDSLYISYKGILESIKDSDSMSLEQKRDIIIDLNTKFLDQHNYEYIKKYYDSRFGKSVHNFELETIALAGVWGDVKKRYAQILLWKDGKKYDIDKLPMKVKGLEIVKSSFPEMSRNMLSHLFRFLLEHAGDNRLIQKLNKELGILKQEWSKAHIEKISGSVKVNNYNKYIADDTGAYIKLRSESNTAGRKIAVPWNVKALAKYNQLRNYNKLDGEPIYGGKLKWYIIKSKTRDSIDEWFAYTAANYPRWADKYAPIDRERMFQQTVVDPLNRILKSNNMTELSSTGDLQLSLF